MSSNYFEIFFHKFNTWSLSQVVSVVAFFKMYIYRSYCHTFLFLCIPCNICWKLSGLFSQSLCSTLSSPTVSSLLHFSRRHSFGYARSHPRMTVVLVRLSFSYFLVTTQLLIPDQLFDCSAMPWDINFSSNS